MYYTITYTLQKIEKICVLCVWAFYVPPYPVVRFSSWEGFSLNLIIHNIYSTTLGYNYFSLLY